MANIEARRTVGFVRTNCYGCVCRREHCPFSPSKAPRLVASAGSFPLLERLGLGRVAYSERRYCRIPKTSLRNKMRGLSGSSTVI